jgi:hypothetical protein
VTVQGCALPLNLKDLGSSDVNEKQRVYAGFSVYDALYLCVCDVVRLPCDS